MSRAAIGRMVVRIYPKAIQESTGEELLGTLLEAGDESLAHYVRQLISLARSGLLARARSELNQPLPRIAMSTLCWLAVMSVIFELVETVGIGLRWGGGPGSDTQTTLYCYIIPALILVLFTLGRNRSTGILGLAWLAIFLHQHPTLPLSGFVQSVPLQAAGFVLLVLKPRAPLPAGRFLWPVPAIVWMLYQVTLLGQLSGVGRVTPVLAALVLLPWAPSFALGTAVSWALTGIFYFSQYQALPTFPHLLVEAIELFACVPLALTVAWTTRRAARRVELGNR